MLIRTSLEAGRWSSRRRHAVPVFAAIVVACIALVGCRQSNQAGTLSFVMGKSVNTKDSQLSKAQLAALEQRVTLQATGSGLPVRGTPSDSASYLRLTTGQSGGGLAGRTSKQSNQ